MSVNFNGNLTGRVNVDNLFDKAICRCHGRAGLSGSGTDNNVSAAGEILKRAALVGLSRIPARFAVSDRSTDEEATCCMFSNRQMTFRADSIDFVMQ